MFLVVLDADEGAPLRPITPRQAELLAHLRQGRTNERIARRMKVAPSTVKTMLERLYAHARVANRVALRRWASRGGRPTQT